MGQPPTIQQNSLRQNIAGCFPYLLYWPVFGVLFLCVELLWIRDSYYPIACPLDDWIPYCEYFVVPYLFWFVFLVGMLVYTLFWEPTAFKKMMQFIMITYTAAMVIYLVFPNCQQLRPVSFERDNISARSRLGGGPSVRLAQPAVFLSRLAGCLCADRRFDFGIHRIFEAALCFGYPGRPAALPDRVLGRLRPP